MQKQKSISILGRTYSQQNQDELKDSDRWVGVSSDRNVVNFEGKKVSILSQETPQKKLREVVDRQKQRPSNLCQTPQKLSRTHQQPFPKHPHNPNDQDDSKNKDHNANTFITSLDFSQLHHPEQEQDQQQQQNCHQSSEQWLQQQINYDDHKICSKYDKEDLNNQTQGCSNGQSVAIDEGNEMIKGQTQANDETKNQTNNTSRQSTQRSEVLQEKVLIRRKSQGRNTSRNIISISNQKALVIKKTNLVMMSAKLINSQMINNQSNETTGISSNTNNDCRKSLTMKCASLIDKAKQMGIKEKQAIGNNLYKRALLKLLQKQVRAKLANGLEYTKNLDLIAKTEHPYLLQDLESFLYLRQRSLLTKQKEQTLQRSQSLSTHPLFQGNFFTDRVSLEKTFVVPTTTTTNSANSKLRQNQNKVSHGVTRFSKNPNDNNNDDSLSQGNQSMYSQQTQQEQLSRSMERVVSQIGAQKLNPAQIVGYYQLRLRLNQFNQGSMTDRGQSQSSMILQSSFTKSHQSLYQ